MSKTITMSDIRYRVNRFNTIEQPSIYNIDLLSEQIATTTKLDILNHYLHDWKSLHFNENQAFDTAVKGYISFCENASDSDTKTATKLLQNVLYEVKDIKSAKNILSKYTLLENVIDDIELEIFYDEAKVKAELNKIKNGTNPAQIGCLFFRRALQAMCIIPGVAMGIIAIPLGVLGFILTVIIPAILETKTPKPLLISLANNIIKQRGKLKKKLDRKDLDDAKKKEIDKRIKEMDKALTMVNKSLSACGGKPVTESFIEYDNILETCDDIINIDRVITNNRAINKKVNLDKLFKESYLNTDDQIENTIQEACRRILSCNLKFGTAYTVALESVYYNMNTLPHAEYSNKQILETVTNIFLLSTRSKSNIKSICNVLENTKLYSDEDKEDLEYIDEDKEKKSKEKVVDKDKKANKDLLEEVGYIQPEIIFEKFDKDEIKDKAKQSIDKVLKDFMAIPDKTPEKLKSAIKAFYIRSPEHIKDDVPHILGWFRTILAISPILINPYLGIITFLIDQFIAMGVKRKEVESMIEKVKKDKEKAEKKKDSLKNEKAIKNQEEYIKTLDKTISKLEEYQDTLHTEKENDERKYGNDDDDDDYSFDDDDDFNFDESYGFDSDLYPVNELSFVNTLKMAREKLADGIEKLTDTEKTFSKRLDDSIENLERKVNEELSNKNREQIIKGRILPSASATLKLILGGTIGSFVVGPYVAIIGVLAGIAISKAANQRERQLIHDEIQVQMEIIDKKKQMAESNNDMKTLEALLRMEAKLKREEKRIKYHLTPDGKAFGNK